MSSPCVTSDWQYRYPDGVFVFQQLPVIQSSVIVRCRSCRTYINPFVHFVDQRRWKCNLCYRVNDCKYTTFKLVTFISSLIRTLKIWMNYPIVGKSHKIIMDNAWCHLQLFAPICSYDVMCLFTSDKNDGKLAIMLCKNLWNISSNSWENMGNILRHCCGSWCQIVERLEIDFLLCSWWILVV